MVTVLSSVHETVHNDIKVMGTYESNGNPEYYASIHMYKCEELGGRGGRLLIYTKKLNDREYSILIQIK